MLPFQYLFIGCAALWALSQLIPANDIQRKMQSTGGLIMMIMGLAITGVITIPQFYDGKQTVADANPVAMSSSTVTSPIVSSKPIKRVKLDTFGPDDLDADIKAMARY